MEPGSSPKMTTEHSNAQASRLDLLSLPSEVRFEIYSYFSFPPKSKQETHNIFEAQDSFHISSTRLALRRVCKQVSLEWDPVFFSTATITVKNRQDGFDRLLWPNKIRQLLVDGEHDQGSRRWSDVYRSESPAQLAMSGMTPAVDFGFGCLRNTSEHTLSIIRKLRYEFLNIHPFDSGPEHEFDDLGDLRLFARSIKCHQPGHLKSLTEVTVLISKTEGGSFSCKC